MHLCRQTTFKVVVCSLGHFSSFISHANCPPAWRTAQSLGMVTWMGVLRGKGQPKSLPLQCQVGVIPKHTSLWSWIYQKWSQRGEEHPSCCSCRILHPGQGFGHAALRSSKPPQLAPTEMVSARMTPCRFSPLTSPPSPPFPESFPSARHLSNAFALHGGVVSFSLSQR